MRNTISAIQLEIMGGTDIREAVRDALRIKRALPRFTIQFEFNGIILVVPRAPLKMTTAIAKLLVDDYYRRIHSEGAPEYRT